MEDYRRMLSTMLSGSEPLAQNLEEQEYVEMQIKANRMVYNADCAELENLKKKINEYEAILAGYERTAQYYVTHNCHDVETEKKIKELSQKLAQMKGTRLSMKNFLMKLEEECEVFTQTLFQLKKEIEPYIRLLRDALDAYLNFGLPANQSEEEKRSAYSEIYSQPQLENLEQTSQPLTE